MRAARIKLAFLALSMAFLAIVAWAQEPAGPSPGEVSKIKDDLRLREQILARQFAEFENALLKLKDRLKRSTKKEDKLRADILEKVLEHSKDASISVQFEQMVDMLKSNKLTALGDLKILDDRSHKLADDLREILNKMREDPRHSKLRDERLSLEKLIKEIEKIIHDEKVVQGQTDRGKTDPKELKNNQAQVTKATAKVAQDIAKKTGGEPKDMKGDPKEGGKEGKKGESKDAGETKEAKKGESKEGGPESKLAKESKKADAKPGDKAEAKAGEAKKKDGAKEAGAKDSKNATAKAGDSKPGEPKKGDAKQEAPKQAEAKPGQKSDAQAQAKAGPKGDQQQAQKDQQQQAPPPKEASANGKKQVQDAEYKMKQAEDSIAKKDNKDASDKQGQAIQDLEKAKKKLEDLLRQLREEELERLLAALQARCEKMLDLQMKVLAGTEGVFKVVDTSADKKPTRQNQQDSLKLSDTEKEIVVEATKAIEMLEAEGSAVAFPEVFQQVRQDMMHIQRRLEITDVGLVTQAIEKDVIDTLKEMIEALKKSRQELDQQKNPPSNQPPPQPQDQKLLDQIAELKMIRSMQMRVNNRTEVYGKMYVSREGEQTADPTIRRELSNLSERQERIFDITNRIAKGDNK